MRYKQFAIRLLENHFVCHLLVLLLLLFYFLPPSIFIELSCVFFFFSFSFVSFANCKCYCIYFPVVVVAVARVCMAWELQRDFLNLVNNSTAATKTILTTTTRTTADAFAKMEKRRKKKTPTNPQEKSSWMQSHSSTRCTDEVQHLRRLLCGHLGNTSGSMGSFVAWGIPNREIVMLDQ